MAEGDESRAGVKSDARRPTAIDARIGAAIRVRRNQLGLRLEDLSQSLGITPHQLQKYETGGNRITASRLATCAKALDVPVAWFYQSIEVAKPDARPPDLSNDEFALLQAFRSLKPQGQESLLGIARLLAIGSPVDALEHVPASTKSAS